MFIHISMFNAIYGFLICSGVYVSALVCLSMTGTGTVSNWNKINGCYVYGWMNIGNRIIDFSFLVYAKSY